MHSLSARQFHRSVGVCLSTHYIHLSFNDSSPHKHLIQTVHQLSQTCQEDFPQTCQKHVSTSLNFFHILATNFPETISIIDSEHFPQNFLAACSSNTVDVRSNTFHVVSCHVHKHHYCCSKTCAGMDILVKACAAAKFTRIRKTSTSFTVGSFL